MARIRAGGLDARNIGASVRLMVGAEGEVFATLEGFTRVNGITRLYLSVYDQPVEVADDMELDMYLDTEAQFAVHNNNLLKEIRHLLEAATVPKTLVVPAPHPDDDYVMADYLPPLVGHEVTC